MSAPELDLLLVCWLTVVVVNSKARSSLRCATCNDDGKVEPTVCECVVCVRSNLDRGKWNDGRAKERREKRERKRNDEATHGKDKLSQSVESGMSKCASLSFTVCLTVCLFNGRNYENVGSTVKEGTEERRRVREGKRE